MFGARPDTGGRPVSGPLRRRLARQSGPGRPARQRDADGARQKRACDLAAGSDEFSNLQVPIAERREIYLSSLEADDVCFSIAIDVRHLAREEIVAGPTCNGSEVIQC